MIRPLLLIAACVLPAAEALALTCVPPDPLRAFRMAAESPQTYIVLRGRLDFDPAALPGPDAVAPGGGETSLEPVQASFAGFSLGREGFTAPASGPIEMTVQCLGAFCGSIGPGEDWLLFVRVEEDGTYALDVDACGSWAFDRVPEAAVEAMAACLRGEACPAG